MNDKNELTMAGEYVSELVEITKATISKVVGKNHATVVHTDIVQYSELVKEIHGSLLKCFDQAGGRSKQIVRFFSQWNNLLLGVFYSSDIVREEKALSKRQYDIFVNTLEEIIEYGKKYSSG